jgi:hypothetical protein
MHHGNDPAEKQKWRQDRKVDFVGHIHRWAFVFYVYIHTSGDVCVEDYPALETCLFITVNTSSSIT